MTRVITAVFLLSLFAVEAKAQTVDPCAAQVGAADSIFSGRPYTVSWKLPAQVPLSTTDPTLVLAKYDGFYLALDAGVKAEALPKPTSVTCPDGNLGFKFTVASGVAKGSHSTAVSAYMLDAAGARLEGAPTNRPFAAIDPVPTGAPPAPLNVKVSR